MVLSYTICVLLFNFERRFEGTNYSDSDKSARKPKCASSRQVASFPFAKCNQFQKLLSPEIDVSISEMHSFWRS